MSTNAEKLQVLQSLIEKVRKNQELTIFLEAMGFFALVKFLEEAYQTGIVVTANLEAYIGAWFEKSAKQQSSRKRIQDSILATFL